MPHKVKNPPIVIMAHGFGCQKDFTLDNTADWFAKAGFASLVFDYRGFGASEGSVWHEIDAYKHIEDYFAALDFVFGGGVANVNLKKVFLWGTSYAGGHVIQVAGSYPRKEKIAGVISQVPFFDGMVTAMNVIQTSPIIWSIEAPAAAIKDLIRSYLGMSRHYWPIYKSPAEKDLAILNVPDIHRGFESIIVPSRWMVWKNYATAWSGLQFALYNPYKYATEIDVPVLLVVTKIDTLIPPYRAKEVAQLIKKCTYIELQSNHFDIYFGKLFGQAVTAEVDFLKEHSKE